MTDFNLSSVSGPLVSAGVWLAVILIGGAIVTVLALLYLNSKKYSQFVVRILERDGFGNVRESFDRAGVFVNKKTNNKRLFLQRNRVGLDCNDIPYIPSIGKNGKEIKTITLIKLGSKNYKIIRPDITDAGVLNYTVHEEDVNWALNEFDAAKKTFGQGSLIQYLPYIALIVVCVIIMIIFIYFFKSFDVLGQVAQSFDHAATTMSGIYNSTTVVYVNTCNATASSMGNVMGTGAIMFSH